MCDHIMVGSGMEGMMHLVSNVQEILPDILSNQELFLSILCQALEVSKERKLDSITISCYFFGYSGKSWGFKFYDPSTRGIFETGNAHFFEDIEFDGGNIVRDTDF